MRGVEGAERGVREVRPSECKLQFGCESVPSWANPECFE